MTVTIVPIEWIKVLRNLTESKAVSKEENRRKNRPLRGPVPANKLILDQDIRFRFYNPSLHCSD